MKLNHNGIKMTMPLWELLLWVIALVFSAILIILSHYYNSFNSADCHGEELYDIQCSTEEMAGCC